MNAFGHAGSSRTGAPEVIDLWCANVAQALYLLPFYEELLTAEERADRSRGVTSSRLVRTISRGMLRLLLSRRLDLAPQSVGIEQNRWGKPITASGERGAPEYSVSHAGHWIAIAISDGGPLGIDIEESALRVDVPDVTASCLTAGEHLGLRAVTDAGQRQSLVLQYWTRKEATAKANGRGLSLDPASIETAIAGQGRILLRDTDLSPAEVCNFTLTDLQLSPELTGALATGGEHVALRVQPFDLASVSRKGLHFTRPA